mgnify:CR=1 FL=1
MLLKANSLMKSQVLANDGEVGSLVDIYFDSVGRNSLLRLNVPPDARADPKAVPTPRPAPEPAAGQPLGDLAAGVQRPELRLAQHPRPDPLQGRALAGARPAGPAGRDLSRPSSP